MVNELVRRLLKFCSVGGELRVVTGYLLISYCLCSYYPPTYTDVNSAHTVNHRPIRRGLTCHDSLPYHAYVPMYVGKYKSQVISLLKQVFADSQGFPRSRARRFSLSPFLSSVLSIPTQATLTGGQSAYNCSCTDFFHFRLIFSPHDKN